MKLVPCLGLRSAGNHAQLAHLILNSEQCLLRVVWKSKPTFDAGTHAKLLVTLKVIQHTYFTFSLFLKIVGSFFFYCFSILA